MHGRYDAAKSIGVLDGNGVCCFYHQEVQMPYKTPKHLCMPHKRRMIIDKQKGGSILYVLVPEWRM